LDRNYRQLADGYRRFPDLHFAVKKNSFRNINEAKRVVQEKNCRACHTVNGRGGVIGPDLTFEGDKSPEQYDYGRVAGVKSEFAWHIAHFQKTKALVPETVMPDFNFSSREAGILIGYVGRPSNGNKTLGVMVDLSVEQFARQLKRS
jgi:hypothetical protein